MGMQRNLAVAGAVSSARPAAQEVSDQELIGLIAGNDKNAMRVLFGRHNVRVFRFVVRIVSNQEMAEDLVNEVFLEVWRNAGRFEARSQVTTWILAIARNKAIAALRRRPNTVNDENVMASMEDPADGPEVAMQKSDRSAVLRDCLEQLSPAHREIIDLVYYHERSVGEVAKIIRVPVNTVKTRMFYARKHLAELMAERGIDRASL
jgi:RNA polymerase sigma-70 factor (ECF subfamily)